MTFEIADRIAAARLARITGAVYLLYMVVSVLANSFGNIGLGGARQIYGSITTSPWLFRLGLVAAFVSAFLFLLTAWGLYTLLRVVNRDLALLFLLLNAVGVALQCASQLQLISAMLIGDADAAAAQLAIEVYRTGFATAQLFFGTWLFPLGYLVLKSGFLPRVFGVLLIADGVCEQIWFLQVLLFPDYPAIKTPGTFVSLLAEVGLALWLLIMGVRAVSVPTEARVGAST